MLRSVTHVFVLVALCACLASCAWLNRGKARRAAEERARVASSPVAVGRVALVNVGERFALIEADLSQVPASGTKLRTYSGGAVSAELRATGVRRRPFLVADLVSGTPTKGDLVVQPGVGEETPPVAVAVGETKPTVRQPPFWKRWPGLAPRH